MVRIFNEVVEAYIYQYPVVRGGYDRSVWVEWRDRTIKAVTVAHYDEDLKVLVVDQRAEGAEIDPARSLETVGTEAAAIRSAVGAADVWRYLVRTRGPQSHPAAALDGEALAASEAEIIAMAKANDTIVWPDF